LTFEQIKVLFEDYQERQYNKMLFEAGIHGIDLNEGKSKKSNIEDDSDSAIFKFKAPEDYKNMDAEDKKKLTQQMIGKHKSKFG